MSSFTNKDLRRYPTLPEKLLWEHLRNRRMAGYKFRRQHRIGFYVVDFVCLSKRLVVELDGPVHDRRKDYDAMRDQWIMTQGFQMLRIKNEEWEREPTMVLQKIRRALVFGRLGLKGGFASPDL